MKIFCLTSQTQMDLQLWMFTAFLKMVAGSSLTGFLRTSRNLENIASRVEGDKYNSLRNTFYSSPNPPLSLNPNRAERPLKVVNSDKIWSKTSNITFYSPAQELKRQSIGDEKYCTTKGCTKAADDMKDKMDQNVNPCDDFFKFACGGYVKKNTIPDHLGKKSMFSDLNEELKEQLRGLLSGNILDSDPKPYRLAKSLFQSCMNEDIIEERGLAPLLSVLKAMGGWPVLEGSAWDKDGFKWYEMVYRFRDMGYPVGYLVDFWVSTDLKSSSKRVLYLDQPSLGLSREHLLGGMEDEVVKAYFTYMQDVTQLLGADKKEAEKQMLEVLEFETELAAISLAKEERRDETKLYHPFTIRQLSIIAPNVPWVVYINRILSEKIIQVDDTETIIVFTPSYIDHLSDILTSTPAHVQANYLMWRAAADSMSDLNQQAQQINLKYIQKVYGQSKLPPRFKKCVSYAGYLGNAVGSLYVKNYFEENARKAAIDMVSDIKKQFETTLEEVDWMDDVTRDKATRKANKMFAHIGYPSELLDMSKLAERYKGLDLSVNDFFRNSLKVILFGRDHSYSKLREEVNKTDWISHGKSAVINAYYFPLKNSIQFPAGILQGVFFSKDRPMYMNYGAIGWVIGHEVSHGFDDSGRRFDENGNLVDWWLPETQSRFLSKAECIKEQYSNYKIPELDNLPLNGIYELGENIADNGGVNIAYKSYKSLEARNGPEPLLPGVQYSQSQLFWIAGAQIWCAKYRPQTLRQLVLTDSHAPARFRVQGSFSNSEDFPLDFKCPVGSNMNPKKKCIVW